MAVLMIHELLRLLRSKDFWIGAIVAAPFVWLFILRLVAWLKKQGLALQEWYFGCPPRAWFGMFLLQWGANMVKSSRGCKLMNYDGRVWISPASRGFKIPEIKIED
jgi:hypothetical protein